MLLRLLLIALAVFALVSLFTVRPTIAQAHERSRRKAAWRSAIRKTAFTLAACLFGVATGFGVWHGWRFGDDSGWAIAAVGAVGTVVCTALAWRTGRRLPPPPGAAGAHR
jgi:Na+/H+ antiporter NhaD/arsenite permease-like protein